MLSREASREELVAFLQAEFSSLAPLLPADTKASCLFQAAQHKKSFTIFFEVDDAGPVLRMLSRLESHVEDLLATEAKDEKARIAQQRIHHMHVVGHED